MDPVAHTLVGASLAELASARATRLATPVLVLGANLPDVDAFSYLFVNGDSGLAFRRGWTHGILAMAVLPLVLTGLVLMVDRLGHRLRRAPPPPWQVWPLTGWALLAVASHPLLDWMNNYGVRLLMPFDGRWLYGDSLFIVDPWFWLLLACPVVLARSRTRLGATAWIGLAVAASAVIMIPVEVPVGAKMAWAAGIALIAAMRVSGRYAGQVATIASVSLAVLVVYIVGMVAGTHLVRSRARAWLAEHGMANAQVLMAAPLPANPLLRDVVAEADGQYHFLEVGGLGFGSVRVSHPSMAVPTPNPVVDAALRAPAIRGLRDWMRIPSFEVQPWGDGYRVIIHDLRYSRMRSAGIGTGVVLLDHNLRPVAN